MRDSVAVVIDFAAYVSRRRAQLNNKTSDSPQPRVFDPDCVLDLVASGRRATAQPPRR
jgi:hypothetical protein